MPIDVKYEMSLRIDICFSKITKSRNFHINEIWWHKNLVYNACEQTNFTNISLLEIKKLFFTSQFKFRKSLSGFWTLNECRLLYLNLKKKLLSDFVKSTNFSDVPNFSRSASPCQLCYSRSNNIHKYARPKHRNCWH